MQLTNDGSRTNLEAARICHAEVRMRPRSGDEPLKVRQNRYMNNCIEQDHRRIKRRIRPMPGFKSKVRAAIILDGIELVHSSASSWKRTMTFGVYCIQGATFALQ